VHGTSDGDAERGRQVYERYCVQCHGERGDGKGEVAPWTQPKPRDFRQGVFKFRSTPYGTLPTLTDLDRTIKDGLHRTLMPPFAVLNARARWDVITYLQTFSPRWQTDTPGVAIVPGAESPMTSASILAGQSVFATNCASCHGDGTGNGPAAVGMVDVWGNAITPADLTLGRTKLARTGRDIYMRVATGINGTPMPGFAGALSPTELWSVARYVEALGPWAGSTPAFREYAAQLPKVVPAATSADTAAVTADSTSPPRDSAVTRVARAAKTITVRMMGDASGYRFVPATVTAQVGDIIRFINVSGGPHNVAFWPDSIPSGAATTLQKSMGNTMGPLSSALLTAPNAAYVISLAGLPAGTYNYYCTPHLALKMIGQIRLNP
jgi:cytochrome c oxidase cbb3-type subunit 2